MYDRNMLAYKLVRKLKNGELSSLFINKKSRLPIGVWLDAEDHKTNGYANRKGWHCTLKPEASHLYKKESRVWMLCEVDDYEFIQKPAHQGGVWVIAQKIKLIKEIKNYISVDEKLERLSHEDKKRLSNFLNLNNL